MEQPKHTPEQQTNPLLRIAHAVAHLVLGPEKPFASHGDHFLDHLPLVIVPSE